MTTLAVTYHGRPREPLPPALSAVLVGILNRVAGVGHLLLYRIVPPPPLPGLEAAFLEGVAEQYRGPVTLARDGTFLSLPAGSPGIEVGRRL